MITFQIGQSVSRKDPGGEEVTRDIMCQEDIDYHTDLQNKGYKYTLLGAAKEQVAESTKGVCISCEG